MKVDVIIIGGGPAGMAAAVGCYEAGARDILILERDNKLGGILNQCIHNGFGLHTFKEELTGPEYAARFEEQVRKLEIPCRLDSMVLNIDKAEGVEGYEKVITVVSPEGGLEKIYAKSIILAMGCRERPRGALNIAGTRPAGIFSAGTAQKLVNIDGYMPGKKVVILGSGDIGLIMARRMTLEGAEVQAVLEVMPYSGGLKRNIVQCLDDFDIPLLLSHTVTKIYGENRVTGVTACQVDENRKPIEGTEQYFDCDTLLLSVGLLPENELSEDAGVTINGVTGGPIVNESLMTNVEGIFACGNVLHVHDLVDYVSEEAMAAGRAAAKYVLGEAGVAGSNSGTPSQAGVAIEATGGVRYTVPSFVNPKALEEKLTIRMRVGAVYKNAHLCMYINEKKIYDKKRPVMAPGEMEQIEISKNALAKEISDAKSAEISDANLGAEIKIIVRIVEE